MAGASPQKPEADAVVEAYPNYLAVVKPLTRLAAPILLTYVCNFVVPVTSVVFIGHFGDESDLASIGLAVFFCNVTGYSLTINLQTAFDTLGSQAFGARNFPRVGLLLQRTLFIITLLCIPVSVLWWYTEGLLHLLSQPPDVAVKAAQYSRRLIVSLPFVMAFESLRRFCQVQGVVQPMLYVSVLVDLLHPIWCWLFIYRWQWGFVGAAWATVTSHVLMFVLLLVYILVLKPHAKETWAGWSTDMFSGLKEYMALAIPGALLGCLEWWAFEVIGLTAGSIGTLSLATHNILANTVPLSFMVPLGISIAASTLIGNLLGAGDSRSAVRVAGCAVGTIVILAAIYGSAFWFARNHVPLVFTTDPEVVSMTASMITIAAPFMFLDAFQCVGQGILRGCGLQSAGAKLSFVGFYLVSLPCSFLLAFKAHLGLHGLWGGMCIGYLFVAFMYVGVIKRVNWEAAAERAVSLALCAPSTAVSIELMEGGAGAAGGVSGAADEGGAGDGYGNYSQVDSLKGASSPSLIDSVFGVEDDDSEYAPLKALVVTSASPVTSTSSGFSSSFSVGGGKHASDMEKKVGKAPTVFSSRLGQSYAPTTRRAIPSLQGPEPPRASLARSTSGALPASIPVANTRFGMHSRLSLAAAEHAEPEGPPAGGSGGVGAAAGVGGVGKGERGGGGGGGGGGEGTSFLLGSDEDSDGERAEDVLGSLVGAVRRG